MMMYFILLILIISTALYFISLFTKNFKEFFNISYLQSYLHLILPITSILQLYFVEIIESIYEKFNGKKIFYDEDNSCSIDYYDYNGCNQQTLKVKTRMFLETDV